MTLEGSRELAIRRAVVALLDGARRDDLTREAWQAFLRRARRDWTTAWPALLHSALAMAPGVTYGDTDGPALWTQTDPAVMPLGAVRAATERLYWTPADDAPWMACLPLYGHAEAPEGCEEMGRCLVADDLIVWKPDEPERWWLRTAAVDVLGWSHAEERMAEDKAVRVYGSPNVWNLEGAGAAPGCCIVDYGSARVRMMLKEASAFICDSVEAGEKLQKIVWRTLPRIMIAMKDID